MQQTNKKTGSVCLLLMLLLSALGACAQSLNGHTTDSATHRPVEGAMGREFTFKVVFPFSSHSKKQL
jgi:hypothetical protein